MEKKHNPHHRHQCHLPCFHDKSHVKESADLIFHGGNIITMNDAQPRVEALAVKGNYIMALGDFEDLRHLIGERTQEVHLKGMTLLPGFIEAHQHAILAAFGRSFYVDVGGNVCQTVDDVMKKIAAIVDAKQNATPGNIRWVGIGGWDVELLPQLPKLSATYMDQNFTADLPLVIVGQSGHTAWANHKALEIAGITNATPSPQGGTIVKDESGNLTGQLLEGTAILMVVSNIPQPPLEKLKEGFKDQWKDYARCGYTTVTDLSTLPGQFVPELIPSTPAVRLACYAYEFGSTLPDIPKTDMVWLAGVKFCADGSPHCGTSCVSQPYLDTDLSRSLCFPITDHPCGILNWTKEELYEKAKPWSDQGLQVAIHAHGDVAIDTALNVYERLNAPTRRHRIEHLGFAKEDQLARCSKLGVAPSMFVCQLYYYAETFYNFLGPERTNNWCCIDAAVKYGCVLSLHTDYPTFPSPSALISMKTAITRTMRNNPNAYGPEHCITVHEALKAYTVGPAWQLFRERELGSLQVNKLADLVILSADPYEVNPLQFDDSSVIRVVETYTGGKCNNIEE